MKNEPTSWYHEDSFITCLSFGIVAKPSENPANMFTAVQPIVHALCVAVLHSSRK
jgi:hypothetical protein